MAGRGYTTTLRQLKLSKVNAFRVQVENGLVSIFCLHFLPASIQFDISSTLVATQLFKSSTKKEQALSITFSQYDLFISQNERS